MVHKMSFLPKRRYFLRHSGQFFTQVQVRFSSAVTEMLYTKLLLVSMGCCSKVAVGYTKNGQKVYRIELA